MSTVLGGQGGRPKSSTLSLLFPSSSQKSSAVVKKMALAARNHVMELCDKNACMTNINGLLPVHLEIWCCLLQCQWFGLGYSSF